MAKKINQKIYKIKKELILQEATIIFEEKGYENMKISTLAKTAGVSQSTIYSMFKNKEGLYIEYIKYQIKKFLEDLNTRIIPTHTPFDKLYNFTALKFEYYIKKDKAIEFNIKNNPLFFNTLYKDFSSPFEDVYKFLINTFKEIDSNLNDERATKLAYSFNAFSDGYIALWLEKQNINLLNLTEEICESFFSIINFIK
jgi:AcrR family transcriptional regulator